MIEKMRDAILAIDDFLDIAEEASKTICELVDTIDSLPRYLVKEIAHPKKKPRGSIRRARRGDKNAD